MNTRRLYTNAYRFARTYHTDASFILNRACQIGFIEHTEEIERVIAAAEISFANRGVPDKYDMWMQRTRRTLQSRRVREPAEGTLMPFAEHMQQVWAKYTDWVSRHD